MTGVYADRKGRDGQAATLAALIGVPVKSPWRHVQPDETVKKEIGPDWVIWIGVAVCTTTLAAIVLAALMVP